MTSTTRSATGLLVLSLVLAACSGSAAAPSAAPVGSAAAAATGASGQSSAPDGSAAPAASDLAIDACALITEKEATTFLGSDPGPGMETGSPGAPACAYGGSLTFAIQTDGAKATYDSSKGAMQGSGKAQEITGVGDEAYAFIVANAIAQMQILKGSTLVMINVQGDPSLQNITMERLTALGKMVAGRI